MHITDLEKVLLRSKEQNAVSKRNTLALQNKLALSEQTFINNAALSSATSRKQRGTVRVKRSPGVNCKSRLLYPGPGFLSSA